MAGEREGRRRVRPDYSFGSLLVGYWVGRAPALKLTALHKAADPV